MSAADERTAWMYRVTWQFQPGRGYYYTDDTGQRVYVVALQAIAEAYKRQQQRKEQGHGR